MAFNILKSVVPGGIYVGAPGTNFAALRERDKMEQELLRRQAATANLLGGFDPSTGITWNQGRYDTPAMADNPQRRGDMMAAFPEEARAALVEKLFPAKKPLLSVAENATIVDPNTRDAQGNLSVVARGATKPPKADLVTLDVPGKGMLSFDAATQQSDIMDALKRGGREVKTPQTMINMDTRQETAEARKVGELYGEMYGDMSKAAMAAPGNRARLARARSLNKLAGGGKLQPALTAAKSGLVSLGVDVDAFAGLPEEEALKALTGDLALNQVQRTKGAVSNAEMDLFQQMVGSLSVTPQGRELIYDWMDRIEQRAPKVYQLANKYRAKNKTMEGFENELNAWYEANPFFEQKELEALQTQQPRLPNNPMQTVPDNQMRSLGITNPVGKGNMPTPQTQQDYDAMPSGTIYIDPDDGKQYRKP